MTARQRRVRRRRSGPRKKVFTVLSVFALVIVAATLGAGGWVLSVASDAPDPDDLKPINKGQNSVVFAGDGSRLGLIDSDEIRTPVEYSDMPQSVKDATVAIEDERFYDHNGIDVEGGFRALFRNLESGEIQEGASTITMQLMRNLFIVNPQQDVERKIEEAKMALEYEKDHTKKSILESYLNTAPYGTVDGRTAIGVEAAARLFFSKPARKLNLVQSALIAGLPQAPTDYNPILNPKGATFRRNEVLTAMAQQGYITKAESLAAKRKGLQLNPADDLFDRRQPYFFDYVENELIKKYGVNMVRRGGLKVFTTVEPAWQDAAVASMESALPYPDDPSSALVAIDPQNGEVKAMASSSEYSESQYNLAAQGKRQPGSTFKTFVLTTAVEQGIDPNSTYYESKPLDLDTPYGPWSVSTYSDSYSGTMSLYDATLASDNSVFAQLDLDVGPENVAETAKKMGVTTKLDGFPAEGLGGLTIGVSPLEMANAYATLAAGGVHRNPVAIRKVVFPNGKVDRPQKPDPKRVLPEPVAWEVTKVLQGNMTGGTGTAAYTGCYGQAGKTGTTDNFTDAWFVGYQPNISVATWVGYPQSNDIEMFSVHGVSVAGSTFPSQIWNGFFGNAGVECESPVAPDESMDFSSFTGTYTTSAGASSDYESGTDSSSTEDTDTGDDDGDGTDDAGAYAPGAGEQDPVGTAAPPPTTPSPPPATPSPAPTTGGVGGATGGLSP